MAGDFYVDTYTDIYTGATEVALTYDLSGTYSWTAPPGVFSILCECWGGGGAGGRAVHVTTPLSEISWGGGGGGGEYSAEPSLAVTPLVTYTFTVGPGGVGSTGGALGVGGIGNPGGPSSFPGDSVTVTANPGQGGHNSQTSATGGAGGTGSTNTTHHNGGAGGTSTGSTHGGGGGGSGGTAAAGNSGSATGPGATAVAGGGSGGDGGSSASGNGHAPGDRPGGGGGGAAVQTGLSANTWVPGQGKAGQVRITYTFQGFATLTGGNGWIYASQAGPVGIVVNQWAGTVEQNQDFGYSPPGIQSVIVPLTPAASLGAGPGVPTAGNWLFCVAGWQTTETASVAVGDDSHMWWRPARTSLKSATTTTSVWYQPNIVPPGAVYVSPNAYIQGMAVTVIEVSGLGPWDTVAGLDSNHSSAPLTSLPMSLAAPASTAFILAAACGGDATAGTSVTPTGWIPLTTVTASNGSDTTGDAAVATAIMTTAGAVSIAVNSSSAEPLSCAMVSVLSNGTAPGPVSGNAAWPSPVIFEAAFGAGYGTPLDAMPWTNLQSAANGRRLRHWQEATGVQYELDSLEASELTLLVDNPDGFLSPFNYASPWVPVVPGTPVRMRMVPPASTGVNRWYVFQRFAERWPQSWDAAFRGLSQMTATDAWAVINKTLPACYRAEVIADAPYAWWPCDDSGVNNAASLINIAPGNSLPLQITTMPDGLSAVLTQYPFTYAVAYSAVEAFAVSSGWMYGDSLSAAWQQTGVGLSSTGRYLACTDPAFPTLGDGITIEGWWNFGFLDPDGQGAQAQGPYGQPSDQNLILWAIYDASAVPAAGFQVVLDSSGHVIFQYANSAGSFQSVTVVGSVDKRDGAWMHVVTTLSTSGYSVQVNGGSVGSASGTYTGGLALTTFDTFSALGGPSNQPVGAAPILIGCGNAAVAHLAIYSQVLPAARIMAHVNAAYTAFGQIPPPVISSQLVDNGGGSSYDPSGTQRTGQFFGPPGAGQPTLAAVATGIIGNFSSAPSSPASFQLIGAGTTTLGFMWLDSGSGNSGSGNFAVARYQWFTGPSAGSEQNASASSHPYLYVNAFGIGSPPPAVASSLGDTVQWRIERLLQQGQSPVPRCIDASSEPVVAELDTAGQITADAVNNITASDGGLMFVDNMGFLCYWDRAHLAAQQPAWQAGPGTIAPLNLNFGFEGGVYPWTANNGGTLSQTAIWSHSGTRAALFTGNGTTAGPGIISENVYGIMTASTYSASSWLYSPQGYATGISVSIRWHDSSGTLISAATSPATVLAAATPVQVTVSGAAPAGVAYANLEIFTSGTPSSSIQFLADDSMLIIGSFAVPTLPYGNEATWDTDPQKVLNDIEITQVDITQQAAQTQSGLSTGSGEQAGGLVFGPSASLYPQVLASQLQYGDNQFQLTSYLQDTAAIQAQADWLFANFGTPVQRITGLTIDAAARARSSPYSWIFVLSVNVGDLMVATQRQPGQPPFSGTWRITRVERTFSFGEGGSVEAAAVITADFYPPSEWT